MKDYITRFDRTVNPMEEIHRIIKRDSILFTSVLLVFVIYLIFVLNTVGA